MSYDAVETSRYSGTPVELYQFVWGDTYFRYTSSDRQQERESEVFEPAVISRSEIDQSQEDSAGNIEVSVPRDNAVAQLFIPYIPSTPVGLTIWRKHRVDEEAEFVVLFVGKVLSMRYESDPSRSILTCGPISEAFRKTIPIVLFQPQCNHALYSPGCGVAKEAFKTTGTVTAIDGFTISADEFASTGTPDGWFNNGWVQKGNDIRWVVNHVGDTITLMNPFTDLEVSDEVDAYAGCNRDEPTCHGKFGNLANHFGFRRIPTQNPFSTSNEY